MTKRSALTLADRAVQSGERFYQAARVSLEEGRPEEALVLLDKAEVAFLDEGMPLASMRTALGRINVLDDLARNTASIAVAEKLRSDLRQLELGELSNEDRALHSWLCAAAAENLGATLGLVGRHAQAVEANETARGLYETAGSATDRARVQANVGVSLIHMGGAQRARRALDALTSARQHFVEVGDELLAHRCSMYESRALALIGEYGESLDRLAQTGSEMTVMSSAADAVVGPDILRLELTRAGVLETLNLFNEAIELCDRLDPEFRQRKMIRDTAATRDIAARALLGLGRVHDATRAASEAIDLFEDADLAVRAAHARITRARCLAGEEGCAEIDNALHVLEESREFHGAAEAALVGAELAGSPGVRANYVARAVNAGSLETPETMWRTRWHESRSTSDRSERIQMLDEALATLGALQDSLELDRLRAPFMVNRRAPLESRLGEHLSAGEIGEAFALSANYRSLALRLPSEQRSTSFPVPTQTTLLYQIIGARLLCFVAHPGAGPRAGIEMVDLGEVVPHVTELMVRLDAEWRHLLDPRLRVHINALRGATESVLQELHEAVFAPLESRLGSGPITVVPTGCLTTIPFAALHDGMSYLIDRRAVSIAPGVPLAPAAAAQVDAATLVVGVPDRLAPWIQTEATQIAELTNGELLLGAAASVAEVRSATADAAVMHLASHSVFCPDNPWLSSIRLGDRDLTASEIAQWDLTDKTVVLASCSSGRQANLGEDEMLGLPRSLIVAGARTVVVCLWPVDDIASVGLMSQFHQQLRHMGPAQALRSAQLSCRELHPHPYFWAGPTLFVNPLPSLVLPPDTMKEPQ